MKNKLILLCLVVLVLSRVHVCNAQLINNYINLYVEYLSGTIYGKNLIHEGNFSYPSLYGNLNSYNGYSGKILFKCHQNISIGANLAYCKASGWKYGTSSDYSGSVIKIKSFFPSVQLHNKLSKPGLFNHCTLFAEIAPVFGIAKLSLPNNIFDIQTSNNNDFSTIKSNSPIYGIANSIGVELSITQLIGLSVSYTYQFNKVKSIYYFDNHFTSSSVKIGLIFRLLKDKRYLYR